MDGDIGLPYSILVPKTEITLRNIKIISGSPTTKHYKLRSLSSAQQAELNKRTDEILGEINIDSDVPNGFDDVEVAAVKKVADALATLL